MNTIHNNFPLRNGYGYKGKAAANTNVVFDQVKDLLGSDKLKEKYDGMDTTRVDIRNKESLVNGGKNSFMNFFSKLGVDTSDKINWEADGSHELTDEEVAYLSGKYDLENLSPQAMYGLFQELSEMNAISGEDISATRIQDDVISRVDRKNMTYHAGAGVWYELRPVSDEEWALQLRGARKMEDDLMGYLADLLIQTSQYADDENASSVIASQKKLQDVLAKIR
jgi:hypothetical protein